MTAWGGCEDGGWYPRAAPKLSQVSAREAVDSAPVLPPLLGGGIPYGGTVAEANIAGLPPKPHLADGGPLMGGWYRMGLAPHKGAHIVLPHPCGTPQGVEARCLGWW